MKKSRIYKTVLAGLFAATIYVTTTFISIPLGLGYANLGDCFVLLSGLFLGPVYGFCAAAVGSALADLTLGWTIYAPVTFFIKGIMSVIFCFFTKNQKVLPLKACVGAITCELLMVCTYLGFELFIYGNGAWASVPGNIIQGAVGAVGAVLLTLTAKKLNFTNKIL